MRGLKYSEILLKNIELEEMLEGKPYSVVVLSNIIISPFKEILEYQLRSSGIKAQVTFGDYDNIVQNSVKYQNSDAVILFWEAANFIDGAYYKVNLMEPGEIQELEEKLKSEIAFVTQNLKKTSLVILNFFNSRIFSMANLIKTSFDRLCDSLNLYLEEMKLPNIQLIALEQILSLVSIPQSIDFRYYHSSKALYTLEFYKSYSSLISPIFNSAQGKVKKALIFDCDNTLWKGILGEDGMGGILMSSESSAGSPYAEVQYLALALNQNGVILGLCSKNNPEDIMEVLENHPDMLIRDQHITIKKINWRDKVTNLKEIAEELNIGLDSLVFVDDSDFEVNMVRDALPQVTVIQVPSKPYEYPQTIRNASNLFLNLSKTKEDLNKALMYQQQKWRDLEKPKFTNIEDYLGSLNLKIIFCWDQISLISRMSQLTQKTNQFNLTTKRYTDTQITNFVKANNFKCLAFSLLDRFGDYGVTGLCIVFFKDETVVIDTLLMSCRVIGRNIEFALMDFLVSSLKSEGFECIKASYIKTMKNSQVKNFYEQFGFKLVKQSENQKDYHFGLKDYRPKIISYIDIETIDKK